MKIIAHIENDFSTKFGIPRQSGLVNSLRSRIVFAPEYRTLMRSGDWRIFPTSG